MTAWLAARFAGLWAKLAVVGAVILAVLVAALRLVAIGKKQAAADYTAAEIQSKEKINAEELGARAAGNAAAQRVRDGAAGGGKPG